MAKIYENIIIGNFLYQLGGAVAIRHGQTAAPTSVNLLQQTPADASLADVLIQGACFMLLLEFKRTESSSLKEAVKQQNLWRRLKASGRRDVLEPLSRECHWYISRTDRAEGEEISVVPYLDGAKNGIANTTLSAFVETSADRIVRSRVDRSSDFSQYLDWLALSQGSGGTTGAFIVTFSGHGAIRSSPVADLRELARELVQMRELHLTQQRNLRTNRTVEREHTIERDDAPHRSM